jgi:peptide/nickel transport system substrate-binding protein
MVSGGPYSITQYQEKGTTAFKPNPYFYGPKSHAAAVTLTYYTDPTAMLANLESGQLDFVDDVPYVDANKLDGVKGISVTSQPGNEVTNLGFNSNPLKPKNRELLKPIVREAFEYATPRQQIVNTVFAGHATPWANIMSEFSKASGWLNPAVKPLPYDTAKANAILNRLGYKRGAGGIRVVPATSGRFPQAAHQMSYTVVVPDDLDFDGNLQFQILQTAYQKIGVKLTEVAGGDADQAYSTITGPNGKYLNTDMYTWYWHPYIDPNFNLSVVTRAQWDDNSDTGMNDPTYDRWWSEQGRMTDVAQRRALVYRMEAFLAKERPYIQLVNTDMITAHSDKWTGFEPELWTYGKSYYTAPHLR